MDIVWGFLVDISGTWGIRKMLKLIKRSLLPHIIERISVRIPDKGHFLHQGDVNRPIEFTAIVNNPTPVGITICGREIEILHCDIIIANISNCTNIEIRREAKEESIAIAMYNPLLYPIGLPSLNERWRLQGKLHFRCPYGEFDMDILPSNPFSVSGNWNEAVEHIAKVKGGSRNDALGRN